MKTKYHCMHLNTPYHCQVSSASSIEVVDVGIIWTNGEYVEHHIDTLASVNGEI